jgi:hypothetical protein
MRGLFKNTVEIFDLPDRDELTRPSEVQDHIQGHQASEVCATLVDGHPIWHFVCADSLLEKPASRC